MNAARLRALLGTALLLAPLPTLAHDDHVHAEGVQKPGAVIARMQRGPETVLTYDNRLMTKAGALEYAQKDCADFNKSLTKLTYKRAKAASYLATATFICK